VIRCRRPVAPRTAASIWWRPAIARCPTCCRPRAYRSACCSAASTRACTPPRPAGTSRGPATAFWPALHGSGFTPRLLAPGEQALLAGYGLGITNLVARATAQAAELSRAELQAGGARLAELVSRRQPRYVAIAGVTAYRTSFGVKDAQVGPQDTMIGGTRLWIVPNPSGLNAHWPLAAITAEFRRLRDAAGG